MRKSELKSLIRQMDRVVGDTERLVHAVANDAGAEIIQARLKAEQSVRTARNHITRGKLYSLRRARALANSAQQRVRSKPWQTVGYAAGIGFLLGSLLARR